MIIHIKDQESFDNFKSNIDNPKLILSFDKEYAAINGSRYYSYINDTDSLVTTLMSGNITFGNYKIFLNVGSGSSTRNGSKQLIENYRFRYSNAYIDINLKIGKMTMEHLRKDNVFDIVVSNDTVLIPWHIIYGEIIRINNRNKRTTKNKEIDKLSKNMKIMMLHNELIESGVTNKIRTDSNSITIDVGCHSIRMVIDKDDKPKNLDVIDYSVYFAGEYYGKKTPDEISKLLSALNGTFINPINKNSYEENDE